MGEENTRNPCVTMCRFEKSTRADYAERERQKLEMGLKSLSETRAEKSNKGLMGSRPRMKLWMIRATTTVLLWTCVVQLTALGEMWGPRVLKGWPSCFTPSDSPMAVKSSASVAERIALPPKSRFFQFPSLFLFFLVRNFDIPGFRTIIYFCSLNAHDSNLFVF